MNKHNFDLMKNEKKFDLMKFDLLTLSQSRSSICVCCWKKIMNQLYNNNRPVWDTYQDRTFITPDVYAIRFFLLSTEHGGGGEEREGKEGGTPGTPLKDFQKFVHKNAIIHENSKPLDFLTAPSTSFKRIWKLLCIYGFQAM